MSIFNVQTLLGIYFFILMDKLDYCLYYYLSIKWHGMYSFNLFAAGSLNENCAPVEKIMKLHFSFAKLINCSLENAKKSDSSGVG